MHSWETLIYSSGPISLRNVNALINKCTYFVRSVQADRTIEPYLLAEAED
jgi:hypothetical protein